MVQSPSQPFIPIKVNKAWCEKVDVNYRWDELGAGCYSVCTTSPSIDKMSMSTIWTCGLIDLNYHFLVWLLALCRTLMI